MKPDHAVILDNWIPRPGYIELRKGYTSFTDTTDPVETLMVWRGASPGQDQLLACYGNTIADVEGEELFTTSLTSRWQYVNFSNDGGRWVSAVNGRNIPQKYDGTAFTDAVITGASGPITLDPTTLSDVMAHKNRLFFIEKNSLRVWFLDVTAVQGEAQLLDLGPVFQKGGTLTCMQPWSLDGGQGVDDFAVFMTNQGEVAIFQGTDPSDATEWAEVGTYSLGLPLGQRALLKYGSDLAVLTSDGVVPLSQALKLDRAQGNLVALTQKIQNAFSLATTRYKSNFGWQGLFYQQGSLAIFNVPTQELTRSEQYVQNVQTGAWCRFTGVNAFCWAIWNDRPYFGGASGVYEWDTGSTDGSDPITADMQTAFNYFGERGRDKKFEMIRPIIRAQQNVLPALELVTDYRSIVPVAVPIPITGGGALWDVALWEEASWGESLEIRNDWTSVTGIGYCAAARMRVITSGTTAPLLGVDDFTVVVDGPEEVAIAVSSGPRSPELDVQVISFDIILQRGGQL